MTILSLPNNPSGFVLTWRLKECEAALTGDMILPAGPQYETPFDLSSACSLALEHIQLV